MKKQPTLWRRIQRKRQRDVDLFRYLDKASQRWMHDNLPRVMYRDSLVVTIKTELRILALMESCDGWRFKQYASHLRKAMKAKALQSIADNAVLDSTPSARVEASR